MDYVQTLEDLKNWACDLIILQYRQGNKNRSWISYCVELLFANMILFKIRDNCLNVETSVGKQLDVIGKWVGVDRYYNGSNVWDRPYFSMYNYSESTPVLSVSTSGTGITGATADSSIFVQKVNHTEATYTFTYTTDWTLNSEVISLDDYGITVTGTAVANDTITVIYTTPVLNTVINGTGVTRAVTKNSVFAQKVNFTPASYVFTYNADWTLNGNVVVLSEYGITITGSPATNDTITITYTAGDFDQYRGGFSTYSNFEALSGGFMDYATLSGNQSQENQLGDDLFRQLIKLKIIKNSILHTNKNIDDAVYKWSGGAVYTTWGVMELTYHYTSDYSLIMSLAVEKDVLPAPTGVRIITTGV